jgi:molybdenum cofactor cytidylyltransferase
MISCILLAAGASTRFGSPKALVRVGANCIIERILAMLLDTKISEIIVVLGADAEKISSKIPKNSGIKIVLNENYSQGQTSSFKAGLTNLDSNTEGILLLPVDTPFIKKETINLLIETFLKNPYLIVVPTHCGKNGHPPIFSKRLFRDFKDLKNDEPLSTLSRKYEKETLKLPVNDAGVIRSFNTMQEFKELLSLLSPSKPSEA